MFCFQCKKKSVIILECKCEQFYCVKHQLPEKHHCTFKYKKHVIEPIPCNKKIEII